MTLGEKICTLRTGKGLSQEDLAAKLEVSRQSVSKWETGQSVPDLEKIIKLADLFGVNVDELVREGERPQPPKPETKVVYVKEKREWTAAQKVGICLLAVGGALTLLGLAYGGVLSLAGIALVVLGLPLLLAKKHPWMALGWTCVALSLLVLNPHTSVTPWGLIGGVRMFLSCYPEHWYYATQLGVSISVARGLLTLVLMVFTWRAWRKKRQEKELP
ncbi:helix-turn-helix transcriptional regulator [Flintibacter sp. KGMB00164]|uniref:helix-turn-helix domain-containing protein n=1 Tax=Flintibacter sp. KGMB00164 TaxID=2610895 RepID=UPI001A9C1C94|nr:helix-turn-helix transcriptional regulator [Flintibacter sp. KGMB00164]